MRRPGAALLGLLAVGLALAGCSTPGEKVVPYRPPAYYEDHSPPIRAAARADLGRHLYQRDCAFCHGDQGEGTLRGPDLLTAGNGPALTDFMLRTGRMPIEQPGSQALANPPKYSVGEIEAIVDYTDKEFRPRGPEIPRLDLTKGDLGEGLKLYEQHCGACHALTGIGGAMLAKKPDGSGTEGVYIPGFERSSPREIAEAVRTGPGTMPIFGERTISEDELNSIVRYVAYLKDPDNEGGASIGHIGPVAEGAAGWILGLGVLLAFTTWIGTKTGEKP